jgi:hypothetical protein
MKFKPTKMKITESRVKDKFFELGYISLRERTTALLQRRRIVAGRENKIIVEICPETEDICSVQFIKFSEKLNETMVRNIEPKEFLELKKSDVKRIFRELDQPPEEGDAGYE